MKIKILQETFHKIFESSEQEFQKKFQEFTEENPQLAGIEQFPDIIVLPEYRVKRDPKYWCMRNKCEQNAFTYVKNNPNTSKLIGGYIVKHGIMIEHFWVFIEGEYQGMYLDITPLSDKPDFYIGVDLSHLTDGVIKAKNWFDIPELKAGAIYFKYIKPYIK